MYNNWKAVIILLTPQIVSLSNMLIRAKTCSSNNDESIPANSTIQILAKLVADNDKSLSLSATSSDREFTVTKCGRQTCKYVTF